MSLPLLKNIRKHLGPLLLLLGVLFLLQTLFQGTRDLDSTVSILSVNPLLLIVSILFYLIIVPLYALKWRTILRLQGISAQTLDMIKLVTYYQVSGYIPGVVPQFANIQHYGQKLGLSRKTVFSTLVVEELTKVAAALSLFLPFLLLKKVSLPFPALLPLLLIIITFLVAANPRFIEFGANIALPYLGKDKITVNMKYWHIGVLFSFVLVLRLLAGTGFYFLLRGLGTPLPWFDAVAVFSGAWAIGFLVIVVPGGIGIREGVIAYFLAQYTPFSISVLIASIARIWGIFPQFIFFVGIISYQAYTNHLQK